MLNNKMLFEKREMFPIEWRSPSQYKYITTMCSCVSSYTDILQAETCSVSMLSGTMWINKQTNPVRRYINIISYLNIWRIWDHIPRECIVYGVCRGPETDGGRRPVDASAGEQRARRQTRHGHGYGGRKETFIKTKQKYNYFSYAWSRDMMTNRRQRDRNSWQIRRKGSRRRKRSLDMLVLLNKKR